MTLSQGQALSHYTILGPLGAGAMGEVWRARDTRLGREVAIKVLPDHFAEDEERLLRFEREAKTLATLNHPNVAQIYGVDQVGDTCFLVLELVEGESLEERLKRGRMPLDEALDICRQIAEGLEAAHEAGVIHRDLKPANVRITPDGRVKVLDFGLAKPMRISEETRSTDSVLSTEGGRLLGTPTYMAPEQARGKAIDRRIDVWAFGCVLFECLTGKRAFEGETLTDVLSSVLREEANLAALPSGTPPRVRECVRRCLLKDPRTRLRDVGEARLMLTDGGALEPAPSARGARGWIPWALVALTAAVALAAWMPGARSTREDARGPIQLAVRMPHGVTVTVEANTDEQNLLALSPDGTTLVFVGRSEDSERLFVRRLDALEVQPLEGTEDGNSPFFSPDGRWVGFFSRGKLRKVAVTGGSPIDVCDVGLSRGGVWCPDGSIVFSASTTSGLSRVPSSGGAVVELTQLDPARKERSHRWPALLPGDEIAFTVGTTDKPGNYEDSLISAVSLATGERRDLLRGASMVKVAPSGQLILARDTQLLALPLDAAHGASAEGAVPVLQGLAGLPTSGAAYFDIAANGTLVYAQRRPHDAEFELAWISRDGEVERLPFPTREYASPRLSPDGTQVAVGIGPQYGRESDVWIGDLAQGTLRRLTLDGRSGAPIWTRDGSRIVYFSFATGANGSGDVIAWKAADGSDAPEVLYAFEDSVPRGPNCCSLDGSGLLYMQDGGPGHSADLRWLALPTKEIREVVATDAVEYAGGLSPDDAWLAYSSDETGSAEIFVQAFPGPGGRWQVSEHGQYAVWSTDGSELLYVDGHTMYAVPIQRAPRFAPGAPKKLFEQTFRVDTETSRSFDVAPDGRFLVVRDTAEESMADHVNVVLTGTRSCGARRASRRRVSRAREVHGSDFLPSRRFALRSVSGR